LLAVGLLDELHSGVPTAGAPDIKSAFGVDYATITASVLFVPSLVANLIETPLFLLADRISRRWLLAIGLWTIALGGLIAALTETFFVYGIALSITGLGGYSVGLAQATLMDADPDRRDVLMTRWALLGSLGDLGAPLLLALIAAADWSWRIASVVGAIGFFVVGLVLFMSPLPKPGADEAAEEEEEARSLFADLKVALRHKRLMLWLFGVVLCDLLDEIFVVFAALHLRDTLGLDASARDLGLMVVGLSGALGLAISERLIVRYSARRVLLGASIGTIAVYLPWLSATSYPGVLFGLFLIGLFDASIYPLAKAQAYAALPERSGLVNAAAEAFTPLELLFPIALGFVADHWGLEVTLLLLLLQPIGIVVCLYLTRARPAR
jgi:MFS transporter, FSR family, fosmidomycin resistance protein